MHILSIVCLFFFLGGSWGQEQVYVVSAPKVFYLGTSENVVIQAYGYSESFSVIVSIKSFPDKSFTYSFDLVDLSPENKFQNSANLIIQRKDLSGEPNAVSHVYLEVVSIHFSKETKIPLHYDNGFLFIQTDRSVYNLDQSVKVRVYSLDKDLKPSPREVILTFIDPQGSEVATVEEKNYIGIVTFPDFKILSNPKYGLWTIKAKYKEDFTTTGTGSFKVKRPVGRFFKETDETEVKYDLPSYTLDLVAAPRSLKPGIPYFIKISSKGKIVHFGTEKRIPALASQILNLPVTQYMVPTAHLLVYYIIPGESTTELVSDSVCLNIEEKCGNQLQIYLSPSKDEYFPGQAVSLIMETQSELWVALTVSENIAYDIQERIKSPMERVFGASGKSDQACGASGGRNNAEVFDAAGLTVLTNANANDSQQTDGSYKNIHRSRRSVKEQIDNLASQFKHPFIQKCCYDGARESEDSCMERAVRITFGPRCIAAFSQCCSLASELRNSSAYKVPILGRAPVPQERPTYVVRNRTAIDLENWLWEVHHVPKRHQLELVLPDLLTIWEIQGVGISDKGLCVADVLKLEVYQEPFSVTNNITRLY
ncbi:complement C5-like isoform X4 [Heterocephalus glaber]|uniref:Complement C5-like isoform X4 n=1 Tax=Heterocephalus glaber TaxID=10181 RepID=A0AAX6QZU3_HETGA|nr:complement C5-like isoform X4 [Heterocephalus glaber]